MGVWGLTCYWSHPVRLLSFCALPVWLNLPALEVAPCHVYIDYNCMCLCVWVTVCISEEVTSGTQTVWGRVQSETLSWQYLRASGDIKRLVRCCEKCFMSSREYNPSSSSNSQVSNCCDSENQQDVEIPTESVIQAYNSSLMVRVTSAIVT